MDNLLPDKSELLIHYLDGELTGQDLADLEQEIAADPDLKAQLESLELARNAIRLYGLKDEVATIHKQMIGQLKAKPDSTIGKGRLVRMIRYSIAVAASALVIFAGIRAYQYYSPSPDRLFNEQFQSFELSTLRDGAILSPSAVEEAYRKKDFAGVIRLGNLKDSANMKELFLQGMALLETGDPAKAVAKFNLAIQDSAANANSSFKDASGFYLALAYLKLRNYEKATDLFRAIEEDASNLYHDRVNKHFLEQVGRLK